MKLDVTVAEVAEIMNVVQHRSESLSEMIRSNVQQSVGDYLSEPMKDELTAYLGRKPYERIEEETNHRNGFCGRKFTLEDISEVAFKFASDRKSQFTT